MSTLPWRRVRRVSNLFGSKVIGSCLPCLSLTILSFLLCICSFHVYSSRISSCLPPSLYIRLTDASFCFIGNKAELDGSMVCGSHADAASSSHRLYALPGCVPACWWAADPAPLVESLRRQCTFLLDKLPPVTFVSIHEEKSLFLIVSCLLKSVLGWLC